MTRTKSAQPAVTAPLEAPKPGIKRINVALQGGGAHGAFSWGVLDRLLEDERIEIEAISGTSAGAMNAVVAAEGLVEGGRARARARNSANSGRPSPTRSPRLRRSPIRGRDSFPTG